MSMNLSGMTAKELKALKRKIDKELQGREKIDKKKAREALRKTAKEFGFNLNELVGRSSGGAQSRPRYQHPSDASLTWTGKGRQPKWIKDWIASGRSLAELEIK